MTIYDLKPKFQNLLRPLVRIFFSWGITPNFITVLTCLLSVTIGLILLFASSPQCFFILPFFFFIRMALNAIDGMLAKEHNMKSKLGAMLNEITDVISDGFLYYSFSPLSFINQPLLHLVIFFSAISELAGLAALLNGNPRQYSGPSGKSDRAFVFGVMGILVAVNVTSAMIFNVILGTISALLILTISNRIKKGIA